MTKRGDSIVLVGFMGAGKSSVGRELARLTGLPRFDTDELVVRKFGRPITEIFACLGEKEFRDAEAVILRGLIDAGPGIVVTGGGVVLRPENLSLLSELGTVVSLEADEETLFRRVSRRATRPLLQTADPRATLRDLLALRAPLYEAAADIRVDTSQLSHEEVAKEILDRMRNG